MIDDRFSYTAFEKLGLNSAEARVLADLLSKAVREELERAVYAKLGIIVDQLNALGNKLKLYERSVHNEGIALISYRDYANVKKGSKNGYQCRLMIGVSIMIPSGFGEVTDDD